MRVLTLNLRAGGGRRTAALTEAICNADPDVVVLTEFRAGSTGDVVREMLRARGYASSATSDPPRGTNSVLVASRDRLAPRVLPAAHHRMVAVEVRGLVIVGLYLPLATAKVAFWDESLTAAAESVFDEPAMLIGDFNTGVADERQSVVRFFAEDRFADMLRAGWVDAWRAGHEVASEFSWFSTRGNGFLLDHALLSPVLAGSLRSAHLVHEPRLDRTTDHSGLLVELAG